MSEVTVMVALGLLALVVISVLILLWRSPAGAFDDFDESERSVLSAAAEWSECPQDTVAHIFGSQDLAFVQAQGSDRLLRAFERDRRQIALHWVWSSFGETKRIMARHFLSARSSPDLSLPLEFKLVAEFLLHQIFCLMLIAAIRLVGPHRLARLAGAVGYLHQQFAGVTSRIPDSARGNFTKSSGVQIHN